MKFRGSTELTLPGSYHKNMATEQVNPLPAPTMNDIGRMVFETSTGMLYIGKDKSGSPAWEPIAGVMGMYISQPPYIPIVGDRLARWNGGSGDVRFDTGATDPKVSYKVDGGVFQLLDDPGSEVVVITLRVLDVDGVTMNDVVSFTINASNWTKPHFVDPLKAVGARVQYHVIHHDGGVPPAVPALPDLAFEMRIEYSRAERS